MDPNDDLARDDGEFLVGLCISGTRGSFAQGTRMIDVEMTAAIRLQEPGEATAGEHGLADEMNPVSDCMTYTRRMSGQVREIPFWLKPN